MSKLPETRFKGRIKLPGGVQANGGLDVLPPAGRQQLHGALATVVCTQREGVKEVMLMLPTVL